MLKSVPVTSNIVSPTQKQNRPSFIPGFSECKSITDDDKLIEISAISVMIADDLEIIIKACNQLSSQLISQERKGRMNKISHALKVLQEYCNRIPTLTQKKTYTNYASSRAKAQSKFDAKAASQQFKQTGQVSSSTKSSACIFTSVTKIANKKRNIDQESVPFSEARKSKRLANINKDFDCEGSCTPVPFHDEKYPLTFNGRVKSITLKSPSNGKFFSIRELLIALDGVTGSRRIVDLLYEKGRTLFKHTAFESHRKAWIEGGVLPENDDLGGREGRPPFQKFNEIVSNMNNKQKDNLGYITNDNNNTKKVLTKLILKSNLSKGAALSVGKENICSTTLRNYNAISISMDPEMSSGYDPTFARKKNKSREQASRSKRNAA